MVTEEPVPMLTEARAAEITQALSHDEQLAALCRESVATMGDPVTKDEFLEWLYSL